MTCKDKCNKCGNIHDPCAGSHAQRRKFRGDELTVGTRHTIMTHGKCCCTSCRRVTLWHPRPVFDPLDDWTVKAIARVTWGDGCDGPEVEVDWKHGVILDLSGCWDQVVLEIIENTGADEDIEFTYGALSACCGAGAARGCATRTTATITTAADETSLIPIPPFAYAVMFAPHGDATDFFIVETTIVQTGSGGPGASVLLAATGDTIPLDGWTLIGGAESIIVANGGVEELEYEVVFLIGV